MAEISKSAYAPSSVSPPGETLAELLDEKGISQAELAMRMGRPRKTISEIVNGKAAITNDTALQLELVTGVSANFWNAREGAYRAFLAAEEEKARLASELAWCRQFPLNEMRKYGWIKNRGSAVDVVHELLSFLGVVSSTQWNELYSDFAVAFRMPAKCTPNRLALGAWLRRGLLEAQALRTNTFDHDRFLKCLHGARKLTTLTPEEFIPALTERSADAGVALVFVRELPGSVASGATRWLTADRALIQLSLRYRTNDHLWFSFFHEAAHLLLHGKKLIFLESGLAGQSKEEVEANRWAANFLIPSDAIQSFREAGDFSDSAIAKFAESLTIAPGIVVGRLQHEKLIPHSRGNGMKVRYQWTS